MIADELINKIYAVTGNSDAWSSLLDDLSILTDSFGSALSVERNNEIVGWRVSNSLKKTLEGQIEKHLNTRLAVINNRMREKNTPEFLADHYLFTEEEWLNTPFMMEYGTPNNFNHAVGTYIDLAQGDKILIFSLREKNKPIYSDEVVANLNLIRPHLARAAMLTATWGQKKIEAVTHIIQEFATNTLLVNKEGVILSGNKSNNIFGDYLSVLNSNKIIFSSKTTNGDLAAILAEVSKLKSAKSIPIRSSTYKPAILHIIPVDSIYRDLFDHNSSSAHLFDTTNLVLVLMPITQNTDISDSIIRNLFDLTPTEAKITAKISTGVTPEKIADDFKISKETVRTHLKNIFSKTGVNRQSQLVALVSGIPQISAN